MSDARSTLLEAALEFAREGWPVFPCQPSSKRPATGRGFLDATTSEKKIREWWRRRPLNIGLPTGIKFIALDADSESAVNTVRSFGTKETPTVKTARGFQWYLKIPDFECRGNAGIIAEGIDVRGVGGYVVAPPSIHPTGPTYEWLDKTILDFPDWLASFMRPKKYSPSDPSEKRIPITDPSSVSRYGAAALRRQCSKVYSSRPGNRNASLAVAAFSLGQLVGSKYLTRTDAIAELAAACVVVGLPRAEAIRTMERCLAAGEKKPFYPTEIETREERGRGWKKEKKRRKYDGEDVPDELI